MQEPYNTDWTDVPNLDKLAEPVVLRAVSNATVIHVAHASIRNAEVRNVTFELASDGEAYGTYAGIPRAEVKCLWYGRKPSTTWMNITLLGPHREERGYSGEVVWDFGRAPKLPIKS